MDRTWTLNRVFDMHITNPDDVVRKIDYVYQNMHIYNSLYIHDGNDDSLLLVKLALETEMFNVVDISDILSTDQADAHYHNIIFVPTYMFHPDILDRYNITVAFVHDIESFKQLITAHDQFNLPWIISL